jgi:sulfite exporter TauE/SafE
MQRIALAIATLVLIFMGLYLAGSGWPMTKTIEYVQCDPIAKTCTTEVRTYKVGSEVAVFMGIVLIAFGFGVLLILLAHYIRYMFMMILKALKQASAKARSVC